MAVQVVIKRTIGGGPVQQLWIARRSVLQGESRWVGDDLFHGATPYT